MFIVKTKKILTWTLTILIILSNLLMFFKNPQIVKATNYSNEYIREPYVAALNNDPKITEDQQGQIINFTVQPSTSSDSGLAKLTHKFQINSVNEHVVTYNNAFVADKANSDGENFHCWKLASSDYFSVEGEYFYCLSNTSYAIDTGQERLYVKTDKSTADKGYNSFNYNGNWYSNAYYNDIYNNFVKNKLSNKPLEADYLYHVATTTIPLKDGSQVKDCVEVLKDGGKEFTRAQYESCFFADNGTFPVSTKSSGSQYTISIPGKTLSNGQKRPDLTFTFNSVRNFGSSGDLYIYFYATSPSYPNLGIRFLNCENNSGVFVSGQPGENTAEYVSSSKINVDGTSWTAFTDKIYKPGAAANGECNKDNLNQQALKDAGATVITKTKGGSDSECETQMKCAGGMVGVFTGAICRAQCAVIDGISAVLAWVMKEVLFPALGLEDAANNIQQPPGP